MSTKQPQPPPPQFTVVTCDQCGNRWSVPRAPSRGSYPCSACGNYGREIPMPTSPPPHREHC